MSKTLEAASEFSNQSFFCFVADLVDLFVESVKDAVKDRQKRGKTPQKIQYDSYMQWALYLMVSRISVVTGFYLLQECI